MNTSRCPSCGAPRDSDDNFCRRCGRQITVNLPVVREPALPAEPARALPPALVGSVAALAIGTGIEWLARRLAGTAARGASRAAGRALMRRDTPVAKAALPAEPAVRVTETVYVRHVELRR